MIGNICHLIHSQPFYFSFPLLFRSDVEYAILNHIIYSVFQNTNFKSYLTHDP